MKNTLLDWFSFQCQGHNSNVAVNEFMTLRGSRLRGKETRASGVLGMLGPSLCPFSKEEENEKLAVLSH